MQISSFAKYGRDLAGSAVLALALVALVPQASPAASTKTHQHNQNAKTVYQGYFEDSEIKSRSLADWEGEWQSVFPYLVDGTLDPVLKKKAEKGGKTLEEYRAYYKTGYKTDVDHIEIAGRSVSFRRGGETISAEYEADGYEVLTYEKGNRGVRFIFKKSAGGTSAPDFIQFSDHKIAPGTADHYHLYWGDDRSELLKELSNWPTYYPARMTGDEIIQEMLAH